MDTSNLAQLVAHACLLDLIFILMTIGRQLLHASPRLSDIMIDGSSGLRADALGFS